MEENGLTVGENQVYFGDFRAIDGKKAIETFMSAGMEVPDAIICANDAMALAVIAELEKHDYSVPDDIIVTGFDNTYNARHYCPSLTTVSRPLNEAGYKACEMLLHILNGETVEHKKILDAEPVFAESCGCCTDTAKNIRQYKKSTFQLIDDCRNDISLLNRLTTELAETETIQDNFQVISHFINEIDCEKYCICLCSEWEGVYHDVLGQKEEAYQIHGYTRNMSAPLIWDKGEIRSAEHFHSEDMFPEPYTNGGNISYFLPLHFRERCLGYYIITNGEFPIRSMLCHSLMLNISNSIENIRKLIHLGNVIHELDVLYTTDPMCGIYNRNGFMRMADKIMKQARKDHTSVLVAFIDMDGLKRINDNYGHKEGDFALQRLAAAIQNCCGENRICARFGGDEFIIFGGDAHEADIEPLEGILCKRISDINHVINKPYMIDASIGMMVTKVTEEDTLFGLITEADSLMYEQKKERKLPAISERNKSGGIFMAEPFIFKVNLGGMIDILANHLYSSPDVFVRELLQNGTDAISGRKLLAPDFQQGCIRIRIQEQKSLSFHDNGTGLTEEEIHQFLAVIGQSSKRDLQTGRILEDYIGRFGIGMLSCFMVTDTIVMKTKSVKNPAHAYEFRGSPDGTYSITELESLKLFRWEQKSS